MGPTVKILELILKKSYSERVILKKLHHGAANWTIFYPLLINGVMKMELTYSFRGICIGKIYQNTVKQCTDKCTNITIFRH